MTIIKVKKDGNYTTITNAAIRDKRLSFKARGLHHLLLSYPPDWDVYLAQLIGESDKDGKTAIQSAINELKTFHYINKVRVLDPETGRVKKWETHVYEEPHPDPENQESGLSSPDSENPVTGESSNRKKQTEETSGSGESTPTKEIKNEVTTPTKTESTNTPLSPQGGSAFVECQEGISKGGSITPTSANSTVGEEQSGLRRVKSSGAIAEREEFRQFYNHNKPEWFAQMDLMTDARWKVIRKLKKELGGKVKTMTVMANALEFCKIEPWFQGKKLTFDNISTKGKWVSLHERYLEQQAAPPNADDEGWMREAVRINEVMESA